MTAGGIFATAGQGAGAGTATSARALDLRLYGLLDVGVCGADEARLAQLAAEA